MTTKKPTRGLGAIQPGRALPQFGYIKKGAPRGENIDGKTGTVKTQIGQDLTYFRFAYDESDAMLARWVKAMGIEPRAIPFVLPYSDVMRCAEVFNECYKGGAMVHRCDARAEEGQARLYRALDPNTYHVKVANGYDIETGKEAFCNGEVIYKTSKNEYYCSLHVRMHIAPLGVGKAGIFTVISHSPIDGRTLNGQLLTIAREMSPRGNADLRGIPLILRRIPRTIPYLDDAGDRKTSEKWMLSIEPDPAYGNAWLQKAMSDAFEALTGGDNMPTLKAGEIVEDEAEPHTPTLLEELAPYDEGTSKDQAVAVIDNKARFDALVEQYKLSGAIRNAILNDAGGDHATACEKLLARYMKKAS